MIKRTRRDEEIRDLRHEIKQLKTKCTKTENKYRKATEAVRLLKERLDTIQYALDGRYDPIEPRE